MDDAGYNQLKREGATTEHFKNDQKDAKIGQRVESHLLALRKIDKGGIKKRRHRGRVSGASLKIFTFLNGRPRKDFDDLYEHVGVVQTSINPNDRTKPEGFRTCATRIGGTVSMVHTGPDFISVS